ncbi:MAG: stage II sporulation protein M [Steroidobacteraceae bacterium]
MTPLLFEQRYGADWEELEQWLAQLRGASKRKSATPVQGERFAALYRRACEQLALARARSYPAHMIERLEHLTADAHQVIYARQQFGVTRLRALFAHEFPRAVRAHALYVWIALAVFGVPTLVLGVLVYQRPELVLSVVDPLQAAQFEQMYSPAARAIGRRTAEADWMMFGFYIKNNIGIAFQCFASGILFGVGSLFYMAYNGALGGAIAGYVTERGYGETFYSFVVTHAAFELTAIVLAGAAGLRLGHALLAPGRYTRKQALVLASKEATVLVYGITLMLLIAAAIEAFWSSAQWIPPWVKFAVAALCWIAVLSYLCLQGRRAS